MQNPYVPAPNALFALWLANLSALITATPADYGLEAGDATIIDGVNTDFQSAYALSSVPATRTKPTIAATVAARTAAEATVRPYCTAISQNSGVTDELKLGLGINLPTKTRTPIPPPTTQPILGFRGAIPGQITLEYSDSAAAVGKAKPFGARNLELRQTLSTAPETNPEAGALVGLYTKSPLTVAYSSGDTGKFSTLWARWRTLSGPAGISQVGPWSAALTINVL